MSNGPIICCAAGICCPPENPNGLMASETKMTRTKALAKIMRESGTNVLEMASGVHAKLDTTPRSTGAILLAIGESGKATPEQVATIVGIYKPFLAERDSRPVELEAKE